MVWLTTATGLWSGRRTMNTTWVTAGLAGLLAIGAAIGVVQAANSSAPDRVKPSSSAPVYGAR